MARKKKHHARRRRSHGMGAIGKNIDFTNILTMVGGAVGAKALNKVVPSTINPKIVSGGKIALGLFLPMVSKNPKTKGILRGVGNGVMVVGALELLNNLGVLQGLGATDKDMLVVSLDGADLPTINGADLPTINGMHDNFMGEDLGASILDTNVLGATYDFD